MKKNVNIIYAIGLILVLAGCSDDSTQTPTPDGHHHSHDGGGDLDTEGCTHLKQGPYLDVNAGSDSKSAGQVKSDHHAYRVSLGTATVGYVKYAASAKGDHALYLDTAVTLTVEDDQGKTVALEKSESSITACTEVKGKHTVELPSVGMYYFKLTASAAGAKVTMVIEADSH